MLETVQTGQRFFHLLIICPRSRDDLPKPGRRVPMSPKAHPGLLARPPNHKGSLQSLSAWPLPLHPFSLTRASLGRPGSRHTVLLLPRGATRNPRPGLCSQCLLLRSSLPKTQILWPSFGKGPLPGSSECTRRPQECRGAWGFAITTLGDPSSFTAVVWGPERVGALPEAPGRIERCPLNSAGNTHRGVSSSLGCPSGPNKHEPCGSVRGSERGMCGCQAVRLEDGSGRPSGHRFSAPPGGLKWGFFPPPPG